MREANAQRATAGGVTHCRFSGSLGGPVLRGREGWDGGPVRPRAAQHATTTRAHLFCGSSLRCVTTQRQGRQASGGAGSRRARRRCARTLRSRKRESVNASRASRFASCSRACSSSSSFCLRSKASRAAQALASYGARPSAPSASHCAAQVSFAGTQMRACTPPLRFGETVLPLAAPLRIQKPPASGRLSDPGRRADTRSSASTVHCVMDNSSYLGHSQLTLDSTRTSRARRRHCPWRNRARRRIDKMTSR